MSEEKRITEERRRLAVVDAVLDEVRTEVRKAVMRHRPLNSPHEAYAVIAEELDELWDEVKADKGRELSAFEEAVQVAAMGVRYVADLRDEYTRQEQLKFNRARDEREPRAFTLEWWGRRRGKS